jgi:Tfp pilus assembly protein PilO
MTSRVNLAVAGLIVAAAAFAGWKMFVAPKRAQTGEVAAQIVVAQERVAAANSAIALGRQARTDLLRDKALLARLAEAVPTDDDVGPLVRQLDAIARANRIDFRSAKLVSGGAGAAAAAAPAAAKAAATEGKDDASGDAAKAGDDAAPPPGEDVAPADGGEAPPVASVVIQPPPGAVVGEAGLLTVPFSFTFDGGYRELERFLAAVHALAKSEGGKIKVRGRLVTIDGFSLSAAQGGFPELMAVVSATAYLLPEETVPAASVAPTTATATATAPGAGAQAKP